MTATRWCRVCGWKGSYASAAMADHRKRIHSCEKWIQKAAAAERQAQRMAAVDRTPKPCLHNHAAHVHGTRLAYVRDACRCLPCAHANRDYEADRYRQQVYGRWTGLVDAEPAREHVHQLMDAGMGLKQIVNAGVSAGTLNKLLYGYPNSDAARRPPARRIRPATAEKILAVELRIADGARVDATGTVRRVRALVALGYSQAKIAAALGIHTGNFHYATGVQTVTKGTARAVEALYDAWSMTLPPRSTHREKISHTRARRYADLHGWFPPLAWDDIDDPNEHPTLGADVYDPESYDDAVVVRILAGEWRLPSTNAERRAVVARWSGSLNDLARLTGWKVDRYTQPRLEGTAA